MRKKPLPPRGIRNNNPLNVRIGNAWLGERSNPTDGVFEEFVTMEYGLRAAFVILRRYIRRYHRNTISLIISSWAPQVENKTDAYIEVVSARMNYAADCPIDYDNEETMVNLVMAMAYVECGVAIDRDRVIKAYNMA